MRTQRRGLKIAMSPEEVDAFLEQERVCRLSTVGPDRRREDPVHDGRHAWLRLVPEKVVSWDFRKLARSAG